MRRLPSGRTGQRGAAALAVTLLLVVVMGLGAASLHRSLMVEQRASANQYAAAQAFEAAEAGLEWVEAQLNANRRLGADCLPASDPGAEAFRERYLRLEPGSGRLLPRLPGLASLSRPGCVGSAAGFACSCPSGGSASLARPPGDGPFPAFRVDLLADSRPGTIRVVSTGCSSALPPCIDAGVGRADATARVEVVLGLLGTLRIPPTALLTAAGGVDASSAVFAATGAAIRAGGPVVVERGTNGAVPTVRTDPALAALTPERFFAASFGLSKTHWAAQPVATQIVCRTGCAAALTAAADERGAGATVWVDGDLDLSGPIVLGSTARPVLVVVGGEARLHGAIEIHGALYAANVAWDDAGSGAGASVHGALLTERGYRGSAAVAFIEDPSVLTTLTRLTGSFARVGGSWRDFE